MDTRARRRRPGDPGLDLAALNRILVVNAGSTSLKLSIVDESGATTAVDDFVEADAVGHRIVHFGDLLVEAELVDDWLIPHIEEGAKIAPLHNQPALDALRSAQQALPNLPHVAVSDSYFHHTMPDHVRRYAVPADWTGHHASWLSRARRSLGRRTQAGVAARGLPPRRRRLRDGCARRALGRHDDGFHAARGRSDGDALRLDRPRHRFCTCCESGMPVDELDRRSTRSPASRHSEGSTHRSGSPSTPTASRRPSLRWRPPSGASTPWPSRAAWGRTERRPRSRRGPAALPRRLHRRGRTRPRGRDDRKTGPRPARSVIPRTRPRALCGGRSPPCGRSCVHGSSPAQDHGRLRRLGLRRARARRRRRALRLRIDALRRHCEHNGGGAATTAAARAQLHRRHVEARYHETSGEPADKLVEKAHELEADLIVIGRRNGNRRRAFPGSVSSRVVRHAPCDVLLVR